MGQLIDIATTLRSKNADPFITTCDVFIRDEHDYRWLKGANLLTAEVVAERYSMPPAAVLGIYFVDTVQAVKISFYKTRRGQYIASGDLEDVDLVGAQQHVPLASIPIPDVRTV